MLSAKTSFGNHYPTKVALQKASCLKWLYKSNYLYLMFVSGHGQLLHVELVLASILQ